MIFERDIILPLEGGSPIRDIVDPNGTLPDIHFVMSNRNYNATQEYVPMHNVLYGSEEIGTILVADQLGYKECNFAGIKLSKDYIVPRQGFGLATYVLAIETAHNEGFSFVTGIPTTGAAKRVWEKFIKLGVAEVHSPFRLSDDETIDEPDEWDYVGDVRIPPIS
jgi:hypothetical protein